MIIIKERFPNLQEDFQIQLKKGKIFQTNQMKIGNLKDCTCIH